MDRPSSLLLRGFPCLALCIALFLAVPRAAPAQHAAHLRAIPAEYRVAGLDERRFTHEELWSALSSALDRDRADRLRRTPLGHSVEGRSIEAISFGDGPTTVLLWSQMHGDESAASMSLADIVHWVAGSQEDDPLRRLLEDRLTVTMIPMLNPDGAERFIRHNALGVDVNRDARKLATPEGRILKAVRDSTDADFGFNLHDQGSRTAGPEGELVAIALLAPAADEARSWGEVRTRARHVSAVIADALAGQIPGRMARYDDSFAARAFGDNFAAWGTSTILIESGALPDDPQKQRLRALNVIGILAALEAIADGSWADTPTAGYDDLPMNVGITNDIILRGGQVVMPGGADGRGEPGDPAGYAIDVAIVYDDAVARTGPRYGEIGDLEDVRALEEVDATGLYLHPDFGETGYLRRGEPVRLTIRRGPDPDSDVVRRIP